MWLFLPDAFVSVVAHDADPGAVLVRGRLSGDVQAFLKRSPAGAKYALEVLVTPDADYRYRCAIPRAVFEQCLAAAAANVRYTNFKGESDRVTRHEYTGALRHRMHAEAWRATRAAQENVVLPERAFADDDREEDDYGPEVAGAV